MALVLTQDETMLVDSARGLLEREAPVTAFRALRDSGEPLAWDRSLYGKLAENGLVAPIVAEGDDGVGMGIAAAGLVLEQSGHVLAAAPLLSAAISATLIAGAAGDSQHVDLLGPIVAGERVVAPALDEAARHDPSLIETRAERSGDGWSLSGAKTAVIDGHKADGYIISAMADGAPALFLVEKGASGLTVEKFTTVDSRNYAKLTLSGTPAVRLGEGDASAGIAAGLDVGRALLAAELLGVADEAFDRTVSYLKERRQFDRVIGSFQALQHRAARMYARLDIVRGVVLKALRALDEGHADATWLASLAKGTMTRLARDVMMEAMQMHGGIGMTDDFDVGLFVKRAQSAGELLGDDHFQTERLAAG
ncbi:MAG: acyl-CoA dehydrogenase family protein, partial [Alphaproteobacteria bacterium]|nr:acyl-CoA dehydrogenase family protein [Alphaproteobacteria bacterium]